MIKISRFKNWKLEEAIDRKIYYWYLIPWVEQTINSDQRERPIKDALDLEDEADDYIKRRVRPGCVLKNYTIAGRIYECRKESDDMYTSYAAKSYEIAAHVASSLHLSYIRGILLEKAASLYYEHVQKTGSLKSQEQEAWCLVRAGESFIHIGMFNLALNNLLGFKFLQEKGATSEEVDNLYETVSNTFRELVDNAFKELRL